MQDMELIRKKLDSITNLPTLPVVIQKLGKAIRDPNADARRIARIIEDDQVIMARILKVVNSVFYAALEPVTSIEAAVARIGMRSINNIALSTSVFSSFGRSGHSDFDRQEFWKHSICTGIAADVVYRRTKANIPQKLDKGILHLAGLLHDLGKIILDEYFHDKFVECLKSSIAGNIPLYEAEHKVLGMDHTYVGGWLGSKWSLSEEFVEVICCHHNPDIVAKEAIWPIVALVHTADYICNLEHLGISGNPVPGYIPGVWKKIGMSAADIPAVVDEVKEESKKSEILMALTE